MPQHKHPLLRPLLVTKAGLCSPAAPQAVAIPAGEKAAVFFYCLKGQGWCQAGTRLYAIRAGDFLALPPDAEWSCGTPVGHPWTAYWAHATGELVPEYLAHLQGNKPGPVLNTGEDPQLARLFNEIVRIGAGGATFPHLLQASQALGYLLAHVIAGQQLNPSPPSEAPQKVAQSIIYMSENLGEPLRVTALARLAGLSTAHFGVLFKEQTGSSPRDYLHLLRIHKACQLLRASNLQIKEIASRLGYQDQFHFSRQFKAFEGVSPSDYRARKSPPASGQAERPLPQPSGKSEVSPS